MRIIIAASVLISSIALAQTRVFKNQHRSQLNSSQQTSLTNLIDARSPGCVWQEGRFVKLTRAGLEVIDLLVECEVQPGNVAAIPHGACIEVR